MADLHSARLHELREHVRRGHRTPRLVTEIYQAVGLDTPFYSNFHWRRCDVRGRWHPVPDILGNLSEAASFVERVLPKAEGWLWIVDGAGRSTIFRTGALSLKHNYAQEIVPDEPAAALVAAALKAKDDPDA